MDGIQAESSHQMCRIHITSDDVIAQLRKAGSHTAGAASCIEDSSRGGSHPGDEVGLAVDITAIGRHYAEPVGVGRRVVLAPLLPGDALPTCTHPTLLSPSARSALGQAVILVAPTRNDQPSGARGALCGGGPATCALSCLSSVPNGLGEEL
jgi:hypothetical protein